MKHSSALSPNAVALILLLEGLASSGLQMLVIRQTTAHVGSSVLITSIVISMFLAALAAGYYWGGQIQSKAYLRTLKVNLGVSIVLFGVGLSYVFVDSFFGAISALVGDPLIQLALYCALILVPLVFLLAQTVPLLLNTAKDSTRKSTAAGNLTALSTVGNVIGALLTTLVIMVYFGVGMAVFVNVTLLAAVLLYLLDLRQRSAQFAALATLVALSFIYVLNVKVESDLFDSTSEYSNLKVVETDGGRALMVNQQFASFIDDAGRPWPYVTWMRDALRQLDTPDVLVLGAGGFTLSADSDLDGHFTYVDIDEDLYPLAQEKFLKEKVRGEWVATDARAYLLGAQRQFDAIVVDLFSSAAQIPAHTATVEFFELVDSRVAPGGLVTINVIADPRLTDPYSLRMDQTIRAALPRCTTQLSQYAAGLQNIVYFCTVVDTSGTQIAERYTDDRQSVGIDSFRLVNQRFGGDIDG